MQTTVDAIGNVRGVFPASKEPAHRVVLGSHLDTVPNAGAFDGILGVVVAIAAVEALGGPLPFSIEIVGFSEEEGIRFRKPFLGSLAAVGQLTPETLALTDADGASISSAITHFGLNPDRVGAARFGAETTAYLEIHIEQGPVLETLRWSAAAHANAESERSVLGVVESIVGQSRVALRFQGLANHAGTTPMHLRHDALAAAAEWITDVERVARERDGLVATVGQLTVEPGAPNVIPGLVSTTLDIRHAEDSVRKEALERLVGSAAAAATARGVRLTYETTLDQPAVQMDTDLVRYLKKAVARAGHVPHAMASGAGHDAMIVAPHVPSAMLFVPSPEGLSHHPDESVHPRDVEAALDATLEFLQLLSEDDRFLNA